MLPLGQREVFHSVAFWLGALYVSFPMGLLLYGWNDIVDYDADRLNPRKGTFLFGARGTPEQLRGLPLRIALVQAPFVIACSLLGGARMLLCFAGMIVAAALYNWPRFGFKARPPLEILNQAGYLSVFLLSSWLNDVPVLPGRRCSSARCLPCTRTCLAKSWIWSLTAPPAGRPRPPSSAEFRRNF